MALGLLVMKRQAVLEREHLVPLEERLGLLQACLVVIMIMVKLNQASLEESGRVLVKLSQQLLLDQEEMLTIFRDPQGPLDGRDHQDQLVQREKEVCQAVMVLLELTVCLVLLVMCLLSLCRDQMVKVQTMLRHSDKCLVSICLQ